MVMFESDLERGEQPRLEVDLVVGRDDGHGQRAQREQPERDERREEHGARELRLRVCCSSGACTACTSTPANSSRMPARNAMSLMPVMWGKRRGMDVLRGVDVDDLRDARPECASGRFRCRRSSRSTAMTITTTPGQHRADEKSLARDARDGRRARAGSPSVAHQYIAIENSPTKTPVLRKVGHADHVGDRRGGESQYGGIPDDVLNPLQEDGREAQVRG